MAPWCGHLGYLGSAGWVVMGGVWLAFIALLIWAVVRLFPAGKSRPSAQAVLDDRLARGEIDADTYRRLSQELGTGTTTRAAH